MPDGVTFERRGHVGVFTLDRPAAMNAINGDMSSQFEAHLARFEADDDLWVGVVCSSHPKVFCAGADLTKTRCPQRFGWFDLRWFMQSNGYARAEEADDERGCQRT